MTEGNQLPRCAWPPECRHSAPPPTSNLWARPSITQRQQPPGPWPREASPDGRSGGWRAIAHLHHGDFRHWRLRWLGAGWGGSRCFGQAFAAAARALLHPGPSPWEGEPRPPGAPVCAGLQPLPPCFCAFPHLLTNGEREHRLSACCPSCWPSFSGDARTLGLLRLLRLASSCSTPLIGRPQRSFGRKP